MQGTKLSIERVKAPTPSQALEFYQALKVFQSGFHYKDGLYDQEIEQANMRMEELRSYFLNSFTKVDLF